MTDLLEDLPDRKQFFELLQGQLSSGGEANKSIAILAIRVVKLSDINKGYGYAFGNHILFEVLNKIDQLRRPGDTLGRITGSEFGLVLPSLHSVGQAILAAEKITRITKMNIALDGAEVQVKVAVGIAMFPEHGTDRGDLVKFAEQAANSAENLVDSYVLFSGETDTGTQHALSMEGELDSAISSGSIQMHYQPQVNLTSREFTGVEALARWSSPTMGMVSPDIFIDLAEKTGLIQPLTLLTLNIALREYSELKKSAPECCIAINLSAAILHEKELIELIMRALDVWDINPECLTLEVTESAVMQDTVSSLETLERLSSEKIKISMDDFGTGQSSLRYLKSLPLSELKIDKSFVTNMVGNENDIKIAQAIIDLSHNFDLYVVAEGIEDNETMEMLSELGCEYGQGYYISKPMPVNDFAAWIKKYNDSIPM